MPGSRTLALTLLTALMAAVPADAAGRPDLSVSTLGGKASGRTVEVSGAVRNRGRAVARSSRVELVLSADTRRDRRDTRLGTLSAKRLKAGKTVRFRGRLAVPAKVKDGTYVLLACADASRKVRERSERNNCRAAKGKVRIMAPRGGAAPKPAAKSTPQAQAGASGGGGDVPMPKPVLQPQPEPEPEPGPKDPTGPGTNGVPPVVDESVPTPFDPSYLYTGKDAPQQGVRAGAIAERHAAILHGRVVARTGGGIAGVKITVDDHPELGRTETDADGDYRIAVNGGAPLTLSLERDGYLPVQRQVEAPWKDWAAVEDVVLVGLDEQVTEMDANSTEGQVAEGSKAEDADGERQAAVYVPPGTHVAMELPDGSTKTLEEFHVRATEFTVGESGQEAMPGELPGSSGYTYAAELSVDEAIEAGATRVNFSREIYNYVDNFLGFPVGGAVPTGSYDRETGQWVGERNGLVIKIITETGGLANVDVNGDGLPESAGDLHSRGITEDERRRLAELYDAGRELWRVPMTHFTPWDHNWPYGPAPDARPPQVPNPEKVDKQPESECYGDGSIIACQSQRLGEELPIAGTPYKLAYWSDRVPGRTTGRTMDIPLIGGSVPSSLKRIELIVQVAGRRFTRSFAPSADLSHRFEWDGKDAHGRLLVGAQPMKISIGYEYGFTYYPPATWNSEASISFGRFASTTNFTNTRETSSFMSWQHADVQMEDAPAAWDARGAGLGGWSVDAVHVADFRRATTFLGDGRTRASDPAVEHVAGKRGASYADKPTETTLVGDVYAMQVTPDGSIRTVEQEASHGWAEWKVRRYRPGGEATTEAKAETHSEPYMTYARDGAFGPDGSVYVIETLRVIRIHPDGHREVIAGNNKYPGYEIGDIYDGRPATEIPMFNGSIAVADDGTVYVSDTNHKSNKVVRQIGPDGRIFTIAGRGNRSGPIGDGGQAMNAWFETVVDLEVDADGRIIVAEPNRVRRIDRSGRIETIAGTGADPTGGADGDGGPATDAAIEIEHLQLDAQGALYVKQYNGRIRRIDPDGTISTYAGAGPVKEVGAPAKATDFTSGAMAFDPEGRLYTLMDHTPDWEFHDKRMVRVNRPAFSRDGKRLVPSGDGQLVYEFDAGGRHLRTLDGLTRATLLKVGYDGDGRIATLTDEAGRATRIERDAAGKPEAIVAPGGQRTVLELDGEGWLKSVTAPGARKTALTHDGGGLLKTLVGPGGDEHTFGYDGFGRLTRDEGPDGRVTELARTRIADGHEVVRTSGQGRKTTYRTQTLPTGGTRSEVVDTNGGTTVSVRRPDGTVEATLADGTKVEQTYRPDPVWGMSVPVLAKLVRTTPDGRAVTSTATREVTLADTTDALSATKATDTIVVGGKTTKVEWDAATRRLTTTTPGGRKRVAVYDDAGRLGEVQLPEGLAPLTYAYDAAGRTRQATQGDRRWTLERDGAGNVTSRTDALDRKTTYEHNAAGAVTGVRRPTGARLGFSRDARGTVSGLEMPEGQDHEVVHDWDGRVKRYTAPGSGALERSFEADGGLKTQTLPGGRTIEYERYDGGRMKSATTESGVTTYTYTGNTERPETIVNDPAGDGEAQGIAYEWDGELPEAIEQTGPAAGRFAFGYDAALRLNSTAVTAGGTTLSTAITRDDDGLVTGYGPFTLARGGAGGALSRVSGNGLALDLGIDAAGDVKSRSLGSAYGFTLTRDAAGRVVKRVEDGVELTFAYDDDGRLLRVSRDGEVVERYTYDKNGNRTTRQLDDGVVETSTYDDADRLTARGSTAYEHDAAGFLRKRGDDTFTYSSRGELLRAEAGGKVVTYAYDGLGRRTARTVDGQTTQYLYGAPADAFQVSAVRASDGGLTRLHYTEDGLLFALQTTAGWRYVGVDQVGSPRVVTDAAGTVLKRVTYDAFGGVLSDSAPAVDLPLGYAGGLPDAVTGLVRFGMRDYDPAAGRWTAADPALFGGGQANLYEYVASDPINGRDPSGLICVGGSAYSGIGGGASLCITDEGVSVCAELGLGFGTDVDVDFTGDLADNGTSVVAEVKVGAGPASVKLGAELNSAGCLKVGPEFELGPIKVGPDSFGVKQGIDVEIDGKSALDIKGLSAIAKVAAKHCVSTKGG